MVCCECKNFLGGGDFGTCCKENSGLVYEESEICEKFQDSGDRLYVEYIDDKPVRYRFGEEFEAEALFIEGGFSTPHRAYMAKMNERQLICRRNNNG